MKGKKLLSLLLGCALCMGLVPAHVSAQNGTMQILNGLPELTVNTSKVAFAGREWWVIGDGTNGVYPQSNHITLLAANMEEDYYQVPFREGFRATGEHKNPDGNYKEIEGYRLNDFVNNIGNHYYYAVNPLTYAEWSTPNEYAGSTLHQKMEEIAQSFSNSYSDEYELISPRSFAGGGTPDSPSTDGTAGAAVDNQKLWALSFSELTQLPDNNGNLLTYKWNNAETYWLLRSPVSTKTQYLYGADDVKVYQPGDGTTTSDSDIQTIDVTQAAQPAASGVDCTTAEQNDGKLTGVDNTMEYRLSSSSKWTEITGTEVTGLADGTYEVRVKANGTVLASEAVTVTIGEHTCMAQGGWQSDADGHWKLCTCGVKLDSAAHRLRL